MKKLKVSPDSDRSSGQNGADNHADTISVPFALQFVLLITLFGGQLRINFLSQILKFFCNCLSLKAWAITKNFNILRMKLIHN